MKTFRFILLFSFLFSLGCEQKNDHMILAEENNLQEQMGRRCKTYEVFTEQLKKDPSLQKRMDEIESFTQRYMKDPAAYRLLADGTLELPVVVNVLYNTADQNISDKQINSQIDVLNEDFGGTNKDLFSTTTYNHVKAGDIKIKFVLQQVVRKNTPIIAFTTDNAMKNSKRGGIDATSPETTLNIWVCNMGGGILGYAQFPGGNNATDGIVVTTLGFGRGRNYNLYQDFDLGRTATHEVGHYFNLRHIWGDRKCGNDQVDDTPLHATYNFGCPPANKISICDGSIEMTMNYMDYTDDACMYMFTHKQALRMQATYAVGGPRETLR